MDLGEHHLCLNTKDLEKSKTFYAKLGFETVDDHSDEKWIVLRHNNLVLTLFQGHIEENLINFRGGDIEAIVGEAKKRGLVFEKDAAKESDGSWSAEVRDPDGNSIYFNTFPSEREKYQKDGKII